MSPMNATDVIEANAQRARELLAGAGPEGLTGDALAEFEACEARARTHLEMERRAEEIEAMLDHCEHAGYRVRDLLHSLVQSRIFLGQAGCRNS